MLAEAARAMLCYAFNPPERFYSEGVKMIVTRPVVF